MLASAVTMPTLGKEYGDPLSVAVGEYYWMRICARLAMQTKCIIEKFNLGHFEIRVDSTNNIASGLQHFSNTLYKAHAQR